MNHDAFILFGVLLGWVFFGNAWRFAVVLLFWGVGAVADGTVEFVHPQRRHAPRR